MSGTLPLGWGFAPQPREAFERARAIEKEVALRVAKATAARCRRDLLGDAKETRRAARGRVERLQHMHFALWCRRRVAITGAWPTPRDVRETFGVSLQLAVAYLADFDTAIKQEWI